MTEGPEDFTEGQLLPLSWSGSEQGVPVGWGPGNRRDEQGLLAGRLRGLAEVSGELRQPLLWRTGHTAVCLTCLE